MAATPRLRLDDDLSVVAGDVELGCYVIESAPAFESPRPYWHPIRTPAGVAVTEVRPPDHSWHWGLSLAVANIVVEAFCEDTNLWGGVTWVPGRGYAQLANNGRQQHEEWAEPHTGEATERLGWRAASGRPFVAETRTVTVSAVDRGWELDTTSVWTNLTAAPVRFGSPTTAGRPNAGYGGFFLRGSGEALGGASVHLDGDAVTADQAMGRHGRSMTLTGRRARVTMSASDDNPVTPTSWFVRTEPVVMLCAAPFFHEEWSLAASASATWSWRLEVTDV